MEHLLQLKISIEQIAAALSGLFFLCGIAGYALKKNGILTWGKPVERRNGCKQCGEHPQLVKRMDKFEKNIDGMDKKLDTVVSGIASIEGYLQGKNGYHR